MSLTSGRFPTSRPDLWSEDSYEKAKWEQLQKPLSRKILNQKQYRIPGGTADRSATIKDLKGVGMVIPTTFPCSSAI